MFLSADGALCAIGVTGEQFGEERFKQFAVVLRHADVLFLIHGFKFGVETANHHVLEAVALNA